MDTALMATGAAVGAVTAYGASVAAKDNPSTSSLRYTIEELQKQINKLKEAQDACCKAEAVAAAVAAPTPAATQPVAAAPAPAPAATQPVAAAPAPAPAATQPVAAAPAAAAPAPSQPGFFDRMFGRPSSAPAPAPAPAPAAPAAVPVSVTPESAPTPSAPPAENPAKEFETKNSELVQIIRATIPKAEASIEQANNIIDNASRSDWFIPELERQRKKTPPPPPQLPLSQRPPVFIPPPPPPPGAPPSGATAERIDGTDSMLGGAWNPFSYFKSSRPVESTPPAPVTQQDKEDTLYHMELLNERINELEALLASYSDLYERYTDLSLGYSEKISKIPLLKSKLENIALKTKEVESSFNLVQTDLNKFQAVEDAKNAEKARVAAKQKEEEAKTAKQESTSTSIKDTLEARAEEAVKWYKETISYFNTYIKDILILLGKRAPNDRSIEDKIIETGRFLDILEGKLPETDKEGDIGRGLAGLQKAYDDFKTEAGTQKSGIFGMTRKKKKYSNSEFKGQPSKPVKVQYVRPDRVGGKTRRRGGVLQNLIDLKAHIDAHLEYYNNAKPDIEAFKQEAQQFINAKRDEYEYTIEEEPSEAPAPAPAPPAVTEPAVGPGETYFTLPGSRDIEEFKRQRRSSTPPTKPVSSTRSAAKSPKPAVAAPKQVNRREVVASPLSSPTLAPTPAPGTGAAGTGLSLSTPQVISSASPSSTLGPTTLSTEPQTGIGKNGETLNIGDEVSCDLYGNTRSGKISRFVTKIDAGQPRQYVEVDFPTGKWSQPSSSCVKVNPQISIATQAASVPGLLSEAEQEDIARQNPPLPPSLVPGFGTAERRETTQVFGRLSGDTLGEGASVSPGARDRGGLRKKKLRSRRGGKQKKNGRRTRRS